jgi:hypothetical protein
MRKYKYATADDVHDVGLDLVRKMHGKYDGGPRLSTLEPYIEHAKTAPSNMAEFKVLQKLPLHPADAFIWYPNGEARAQQTMAPFLNKGFRVIGPDTLEQNGLMQRASQEYGNWGYTHEVEDWGPQPPPARPADRRTQAPAQAQMIQRPQEIIWAPQEGPQTALLQCPVFEVFYGGARGGGKTDGMVGDWIQHSSLYGENAVGIFVRRNRTQLSEVIARTKQLFPKLGARYNETKSEWRMQGGGRLRFVYLEHDADAENYQGHNYTRVYIEEVTNFPSPGRSISSKRPYAPQPGSRLGCDLQVILEALVITGSRPGT